MDEITNPKHYTQGGIETIDYIKSKLTPDELGGFLRGNVIKYISRAGLKGDAVTDYEKAAVYLGWLIDFERGRKHERG